jgi:pilus assembly protein Flp/PilA
MTTSLTRFVKDESGSAPIEYVLIAAGITIALLTVVNALGDSLVALFWPIEGKIGSDVGEGPGD